MNIERLTIKGSPYIGVFTVMTESMILVPFNLNKKELKTIKQNTDLKIISVNLADSSLLGILSKGKQEKLVVSELVSDKEIKSLEKEIDVLRIEKASALGNMIALNDNYCVLSSKFFNQEQLKELKEFLKVKLIDATINNSELIGSNMVLTNNGFVVSPRIKEKEFVLLEKELKLEGLTSTINYGDSFVGLGLIANSKTAFVGSRTSGIELMRIDEALSKR